MLIGGVANALRSSSSSSCSSLASSRSRWGFVVISSNILFLRRVRQLAQLVESDDELDLIDGASRLRQLLFDKSSLVDAVNRGTKLTFKVGIFRPGWGPDDDPHWRHVVYQSLQDAIDPQTSASGLSVELTRNQFGQHVVAFSRGVQITILDLVKYNANQVGGNHWATTPKAEYEKLRFVENVQINNISAARREIKAIGRVVVRSLEPLIIDVESRDA